MIKAFQNIISVIMAVLVLFSTFSFTVDKHYCGGILIDSAIFSKAESCGMDSMQQDVTSGNPEMKDHSCSNKQIAVKGQKELKHHSSQDLDFHTQVFVASFYISYQDLFEGLPEQIIPFKDYSPPLLVSDIQLKDQVFLI